LDRIGDAIYVRDVQLPPRVQVLNDPDQMVVLITAPTISVEAGEAEAAAFEPEVIEKGKKEEEEF
jgi:hypothetical protein